ncbi:hypothetical protein BH11ACT8_BH11ACT8_31690 [soil metagenome]
MLGRSDSGQPRGQRGVVFPSPVVMLSVIAVALAAVAFVATRDSQPTEREVATQVRQDAPSSAAPSAPAKVEKTKKPKPRIDRSKVFVEVYNNSGITGLAGRVGGRVGDAGWKVVGTDNWYGSIPTNTVYFPQRLRAEAKQLALDLGIRRTSPAVGAMKLDRLTVILTGELAAAG